VIIIIINTLQCPVLNPFNTGAGERGGGENEPLLNQGKFVKKTNFLLPSLSNEALCCSCNDPC